MTPAPLNDVLLALTTMESGPDNPLTALPPAHYVLCELGEHDTRTEHAALLCPGGTPHRPALWLLWTGTDTDRTHRITTIPWCPTVLRILDTDSALPCSLLNHHTGDHSWNVTDPLSDLLAGPVTTNNTHTRGDTPDTPTDHPR
ncbi:hypothetical protein ACIOD0_19800 [Kitasatospora albolonga]